MKGRRPLLITGDLTAESGADAGGIGNPVAASVSALASRFALSSVLGVIVVVALLLTLGVLDSMWLSAAARLVLELFSGVVDGETTFELSFSDPLVAGKETTSSVSFEASSLFAVSANDIRAE